MRSYTEPNNDEIQQQLALSEPEHEGSLAHGSKVLTLTERLDTERVTLYSPLAVGATD